MGKKGISKEIVLRVFNYLAKYRFYILLSLMLATVSSVCSLYVPLAIGDAIDYIIGPDNVQNDMVISVCIKVLLVVGVSALSMWIMNVINNRVALSVSAEIRNECYSHIQRLPLSYIDGHSYGDVVSRIISDVDAFSDGMLLGFTQFFSGVVTIVGTLIFMIVLSPLVAAIVFVLTPISLLTANFIATRTFSMFKDQSVAKGNVTSIVDESIANLKVVRSFNMEQPTIDKFQEANETLSKTALKATFFSSLTNPSTRFVNCIVYAAVALSGAIIVMNSGALNVGGLVALLSYANQYTKPFNEISSVFAELQNAFACIGRIFDLMDTEPLPDEAHKAEVEVCHGAISMESVCFSYTKDKPLIQDFNIQVKPGMRVAIVGPTGCGKTTMINLLMRFYEPDAGIISLDDRNISEYTRSSLRRKFGMVLQDTWLKNGSVRDNIRMGKPDATEQEIVDACKRARCHNFIEKMPDGYDTIIGNDKDNLSQGQRQLLCIARVMLCAPEMCILDEATSSIDTRTEIKIQEAFEQLMKGKTSFIVAHRLSTIQNADIIIVMNDGKIVETGTHDELMTKGGFYQELFTKARSII